MPTEWAIVEREGLQAVKLAARDTVDGWFNIERVSREYNDYKLVFCPQQAEDNKCEDIGIQIDDDGIRLIPLCGVMPTKWAIVEREGLQAVTLAARDTVDGWFNIERVSREYNDYYKLVFCPQEAEDNKCEDIGIQIDNDGIRRLVLSKNKPLVVEFQKFRSSTA
ncbi:hypothetical protein JHK85_001123 [Glycine max]|nr:hypothetical protein JHK85_001123 [Glycine max]